MRQIVWLVVLFWAAAGAGAAANNRTLPITDLYGGGSADELKQAIRYTFANHPGAPSDVDMSAAQPVGHASTQFGEVGQSVYVFLRLRNSGEQPGSWILTTGRSSVSEIKLFRRVNNRWEIMLDGDDRAQVAPVLERYQAYATELHLMPGQEEVVAIRFRDEVSSWMPLQVETFGDFFTARRSNIALVAGVVVGSLILAILNAVLLAATGQRVFVWLGLAEAMFAVNTLHAEGYLAIFWLHQYPSLLAVFGDISRTSFGLLMLAFGREFLSTRDRMVRYDVFLRATMIFGALIIFICLFHLAVPVVPVSPLHSAGWLFTLVASSALPIIGWSATRRYGLQYLPLFIGWAALAVYIVTTAIAISGWVPFLVVNWHWIGPIGLFECFMATLAVGLHLRKLQTDRTAAEQEAKRELLARIALSEEASRIAEERSKALAALQSRDRHIETSTHDTRHVLHALSSAVYLGRRHNVVLPTKDLLTLIEVSARHLEEIVGSSLADDRRDRPFLALKVIEIEPLLKDLVTIYSAAAVNSGVELRYVCTPGARLIADEVLLVRVLSNLVNNALRATCSGAVTITCDIDQECLSLTVSDTGPGMPHHISDFLASETGATGYEVMPDGFGKGWRAIRESLSLLRGNYIVDTGPGGTKVTVTLPAPLGDEPWVSLNQLQSDYRQIQFIDVEEEIAGDAPPDRYRGLQHEGARVFVTGRVTPEGRVEAAARARLLLQRPLARKMMEHPYVVELISNPELTARLTS